jgi:hypothetical protein
VSAGPSDVQSIKGHAAGQRLKLNVSIQIPLRGQRGGFSRGEAGFYFFLLAWDRSDAIGARSFFGVLGSRKSLPACEAIFFEVIHLTPLFYPKNIVFALCLQRMM